MRILFVHNYYRQQGGEENVLAFEERLLREAGHETETFFVRSSDVAAQNFWRRGLKFASIPYAWQEGKRLSRKISQEKFDVVHIHNLSPFLGAAVLRAIPAQIRCVQTMHNFRAFCINGLFLRNGRPCELCAHGSSLPGIFYRCHEGVLSSSLALALSRTVSQLTRAWARPDLFLCPSKFVANKHVEYGFPVLKMRWLPNACDDTPGRSPATGAGLFLGRFSEEKGLDWLLKALTAKNRSFVLAGAGPLEKELRSSGASLQGLRVMGWQDAKGVDELLLNAGYLVTPSIYYENQPTVCLLAMARGLPLIVSKLGGLEELVEDGVNGFLVEPGNIGDLASAMERMESSSVEERLRMGRASREKYEMHFTGKAHVQGLLRAYQGI